MNQIDEVFAVLLPTGGLWGYRYSHESAVEECVALDERDGPGHSVQRLVPADEIERLSCEGELKDAALRNLLNYPGMKEYVGSILYDKALSLVSEGQTCPVHNDVKSYGPCTCD
jgi:hypothetical protein